MKAAVRSCLAIAALVPLLLLVTFVQASDEPALDSDVRELDDTTFEHVITNNQHVLVMFYAPWCGHCTSFKPEFEAAAKKLKSQGSPVVLARLNADAHQDIGQKYEVQGFPTLLFFRNGQHHEFTYRSRDTHGILEGVGRHSAPDWQPPQDYVIELNENDFDNVVGKEDLMLVTFTAPWCGHCKNLKPHLKKAAEQLRMMKPSVLVANVDATQNKELAAKYEVRAYPTLMLFRNGLKYEYKGKHSSTEEIVSYMSKQIGIGSRQINSISAYEAFTKDTTTIIAVYDVEDKTNQYQQMFLETAAALRDDYTFGHILNRDLAKHIGHQNTIILVHPARLKSKEVNDAKDVRYTGKPSSDEFKVWIEKSRLPLIAEYTSETASWIQKPSLVAFFDVDFTRTGAKETNYWRNKLLPLAKKYPSLQFAIADATTHAEQVSAFGLSFNGDVVVGIHSADGFKYALNEEADIDSITEFIESFLKKKLEPYFKSQKKVVQGKSAVQIITAATFEKRILQNMEQDILIEFYAPWCGHCQKLEPIYEQLAQSLKGEKKLMIAKFDATANDVYPTMKVNGFPSIFFIPAANKQTIAYDGERTAEGMKAFIAKHGSAAFTHPDLQRKVETPAEETETSNSEQETKDEL